MTQARLVQHTEPKSTKYGAEVKKETFDAHPIDAFYGLCLTKGLVCLQTKARLDGLGRTVHESQPQALQTKVEGLSDPAVHESWPVDAT